MFKNYWAIAWRYIARNKTFSFINITGLALGMACSLLILLWVKDERSVDSFHAGRDHLYTMIQRTYAGDKMGIGYYTPGLLGGNSHVGTHGLVVLFGSVGSRRIWRFFSYG